MSISIPAASRLSQQTDDQYSREMSSNIGATKAPDHNDEASLDTSLETLENPASTELNNGLVSSGVFSSNTLFRTTSPDAVRLDEARAEVNRASSKAVSARETIFVSHSTMVSFLV